MLEGKAAKTPLVKICPFSLPVANPPHPLDASTQEAFSSSSSSSPAGDSNGVSVVNDDVDDRDQYLSFSSSDLANEIDSIAIDWRHYRHATGCPGR